MKVMFYVQHLLGIGHLVRASRIARALKTAGHEVVVVSGGMPVEGFPGSDIALWQLPGLRSVDADFSGLATTDGSPATDAFLDQRCAALIAAQETIRPDCVVIEAYPFARRQMRFELLPLLKQIAAMTDEARPMVVSSIRDILQPKSIERDIDTAALVRQYFDLVMVHGDPALARLDETFSQADEIVDLVVYTGLVAPDADDAGSSETYDVIVSAGGGAVGRAVLTTALEMCRSGVFSELRWLFVTGENLSSDAYAHLEKDMPAHARIARFIPDLAGRLGLAKLSISQAGYNTVADILWAGCASVLVPFANGSEQEQTIRSSRLQKAGRCVMLAQSDLSRETLEAAARNAFAQPQTKTAASFSLDGAQQSAAILTDWFSTFRRDR